MRIIIVDCESNQASPVTTVLYCLVDIGTIANAAVRWIANVWGRAEAKARGTLWLRPAMFGCMLASRVGLSRFDIINPPCYCVLGPDVGVVSLLHEAGKQERRSRVTELASSQLTVPFTMRTYPSAQPQW